MDYYEILGISRSSTEVEIKKAYRTAAMKYHPDRNPGDHNAEEMFKKAAQAYEVLSDPQKKQIYDQYGEAGLNGGPQFNGMEDIFSSFGDVFQDFFGFGTNRRSRAQKGRDLSYELMITFEEACFGTEKEIEVKKREMCSDCHGSGCAEGSGREKCSYCGGVGQVGQTQGFFTVTRTCPQCQGQGSRVTKPCKTCHGDTVLLKTKKLSVTIPAGVDHGNRLVLDREGEGGHNGGSAGDLYVMIGVFPHEHFKREGTTIFSEISVSYPLAALGGEISVRTLDGETVLKIPSGSQSGSALTLREQGVPFLRSKKRGDHVFRLHVVVPTKLSARERELLKELDELSRDPQSGEVKGRKHTQKKGFFS